MEYPHYFIENTGVLRSPYIEVQKFDQWWLWILLIGLVCIPVYGMVQQLLLDEPFGNNPMSDPGLILFFLGMLLFLGFFWYIELRTEIDTSGIRVRLRPISKKVFTWDQIQEVSLISYGFVGYGLRFSPKYGTVYNTAGNKGLSVILKNGRRYVVGTRDTEAIRRKLTALKKAGTDVEITTDT